MKAYEAIDEVMAAEGVTKKDMSGMVGRGASYFAAITHRRSDVRVSTILAVAGRLGWELAVRKGDEAVAVTPDGAWVERVLKREGVSKQGLSRMIGRGDGSVGVLTHKGRDVQASTMVAIAGALGWTPTLSKDGRAIVIGA